MLTAIARKTGLYALNCGAAVSNAATDVTLSASWTDPDAGASTYTWVNTVSEAVGSYPQNTVLVTAKGGSTITINATAGTANNVVVGATIEEKA